MASVHLAGYRVHGLQGQHDRCRHHRLRGQLHHGATTEDLNGDGNFVNDPNAPTANDPGEVTRFCTTTTRATNSRARRKMRWLGNARWQAQPGRLNGLLRGRRLQYQDDRFANDKNQLVFPSYWLFNFRAGIVNDSWDVMAYVDNAFDDDTVKTGFVDGDIPPSGHLPLPEPGHAGPPGSAHLRAADELPLRRSRRPRQERRRRPAQLPAQERLSGAIFAGVAPEGAPTALLWQRQVISQTRICRAVIEPISSFLP